MPIEDQGPIVVFDGVCLLCSRGVQFILRHDPAGRFRFASMQSSLGRDLLARHGLDADDPDSLLFVDRDGACTDSAALLRILDGLDGFRPLALLLRCVPRVLRDPLYRHVARRRYRWFGRREQCWLPDPAHAARFLDRTPADAGA